MQPPPQYQLYIPLMSQLVMMRSNVFSPSKLNVSESAPQIGVHKPLHGSLINWLI
jgi:hypothetical protein